MAQNEEYRSSGGDVVDQQTEMARRSLNYSGRFGHDQPTERNAERFAEVEKTNGGFKK